MVDLTPPPAKAKRRFYKIYGGTIRVTVSRCPGRVVVREGGVGVGRRRLFFLVLSAGIAPERGCARGRATQEGCGAVQRGKTVL